MKFRVMRVFEHDIEAALDVISKHGHELLRILDMPSGQLSADNCTSCSKDLCHTHHIVYSEMSIVKIESKNIIATVQRYALVYRLCDSPKCTE